MPKRRVAEYEELTQFGIEVMRELHPQLLHYRFRFALVDPPFQSSGRVVAGRAQLPTPMENCLLECDAWVLIAQRYWLGKDEEWKRYLLDHELSHFRAAGDAPKIVGHDFEDFIDVLERNFAKNDERVVAGRRALEVAENVR